ncbi:MAG: hypothetical protein M0R28_20180 [Pigmentiphaga sp.]|nr:hypothetical protein [Pigmentiphaga sp.]
MSFYGSLVNALAYHTAMGNAAWGDYTDAQREAALRRASRAFDGRYGRMFPGCKFDLAQRLAWPRSGAWDQCACAPVPDGQTPVAIEEAVYELALVELLTPGGLSPSVTLGRITQSEKVDVISRSFFSPADLMAVAGDGSPLNAFRPTFAVVEDLVGCYLKKAELWNARVV